MRSDVRSDLGARPDLEKTHFSPGIQRSVMMIFLTVGVTIIALCVQTQSNQNVPTSRKDNYFKHFLDLEYNNYIKSAFPVFQPPNEDNNVDKEREDMTFLSLMKPVANFTGLAFDQSINENQHGLSRIRTWTNTETNSLYNGMRYEHGDIVIPVPGTYHMYSGINFHVSNNTIPGHNSTFLHTFAHYNACTAVESMFCQVITTQSMNNDRYGGSEYPSVIRCSKHMNSGDHLSVKVSHITLLKENRDWHYFGSYLI